MTDYRRKCLDTRINCCWACGSTRRIEVHHINGDRDDNRHENLLPLCNSCHRAVHHVAHKCEDRIEALKERLPESKKATVGGTSWRVEFDWGQYQYILATSDEGEFSERVRELVDRGMEAEDNE